MHAMLMAALLAAPAAQASPSVFRLQCENIDTVSLSYSGHEPMLWRLFSIVNVTVDRGAGTAVFETTDPEGKPSVALRHIDAVSGDTLMICQADACQKEVMDGTWRTRVGMTVLNLATGDLNRRIDALSPASGMDKRDSVRTTTREGKCRRL